MNIDAIKELMLIKEQCKDILLILDNWNLSNPGTALIVSHYIEELAEHIKPLKKHAKSCDSLVF